MKNRLGTYLALVRDGATIVVTDRGRPIAELRPLPASDDADEQRLAELVALGIVTLATRPAAVMRAGIAVAGPPVSDTIVADREDRF